MHFLPAICVILLLSAVGLLAWFASDMHSLLKSSQRKNQLSIDGRWKDLESYFQQARRPYRPFVWFYRRYLLPGNITTQYALFLYNRGRLDDALAIVDDAIRQIEIKPRIFRYIYHRETFKTLCGALRTRTLILTGQGSYDEARKTTAKLEHLTGSSATSNASLALLEFYCGHLDEALAQTEAVPPQDAQYDSMRGIAALAWSMKGEFDKAVQALTYEPSDISKYYSPARLKALKETPEGTKLIELQRKKHAGIFQPARLLMLANVYMEREEIDNAVRMLDQAENSIGPEPAVQTSYCRHRACSLAAQGKVSETENYIERMRAIVQQLPKRSLLWETHFAAGRAYLYLKQFSDALAELNEAQRFVLHPIEKHATAYWTARTHEAAGHLIEAIPYYRIVAADGIQSWMRKQAADVLDRQNS